MENILEILTWTSWFTGGLLTILLLLSLFGGLDFDFDLDFDSEAETGGGGVGTLKLLLIFISIGTLAVRILLESNVNPVLATGAGIATGGAAGYFLSWVMRLLLRNQEEVNWHPTEAVGETGKVYSRIINNKTGIVKVMIRGAFRELKATAATDIPTGAQVKIIDIKDGILVVEKSDSA